MSNTFGTYFRITTFGESHGPAVGVVIDGVPPGTEIDLEKIQHDLDRRKPGTSKFVSPRKETDQAEILSGVVDGVALGTPIAILVRNKQAKPEDYKKLADVFRPGHADYTYYKKYGISPQSGGGRASGRETVGRVAAGAIAKSILATMGISIHAYTIKIGDITAQKIDTEFAESHPLRCPDPDAASKMEELVSSVKSEGDSIGGIVEVVANGVPAGLGAPIYQKLDATLGYAMLSIGAIKGVEIGSGFDCAGMKGSENNDAMDESGFLSNNAGGILGGISTGQEIKLRIAVKPPSSIAKEQTTVDLSGEEKEVVVKGRHDPCICPRVGPVTEAMMAIVLLDMYLEQNLRRKES
ncbi:MAG TPA: chorismate synthase [bacterium]